MYRLESGIRARVAESRREAGGPPGMSRERQAEVKWDVASPELLRELIASPPPLGLRVIATTRGLPPRHLLRHPRRRAGAPGRDLPFPARGRRPPHADGDAGRDPGAVHLGGGGPGPCGRPAGRQRGRSTAPRPGGPDDAGAVGRVRGGAGHPRAWRVAGRGAPATTWSTTRSRCATSGSSRDFREIKLRRRARGQARPGGGGRRDAAGLGHPLDPGEQAGAGAAPGRHARRRVAGAIARHRPGGDPDRDGRRRAGVPAQGREPDPPDRRRAGRSRLPAPAARHVRERRGRSRTAGHRERAGRGGPAAGGLGRPAAAAGRRAGGRHRVGAARRTSPAAPGSVELQDPDTLAALAVATRSDLFRAGDVARLRRENPAIAADPAAAGRARRGAAPPRRRSQHARVPEPGARDGGRSGHAAARATQLPRHREREPRRVLHGERRRAQGEGRGGERGPSRGDRHSRARPAGPPGSGTRRMCLGPWPRRESVSGRGTR